MGNEPEKVSIKVYFIAVYKQKIRKKQIIGAL